MEWQIERLYGTDENNAFSVHYINQYCLSIPQYTGSLGNRFQETKGTKI